MQFVSPEELARVQARLYARLGAARDAYRQAQSEVARLKQIAEDIGSNQPDGRVAVRTALEIEGEAHKAFNSALLAFNDFVLHHRLPQDLPPHRERYDLPFAFPT